MIANAMAIAAHPLKNGDAPERAEFAALERILGSSTDRSAPFNDNPRDALGHRNRELCRRIREGRADSGTLRDLVREHPAQAARGKVAESNPKALGGVA